MTLLGRARFTAVWLCACLSLVACDEANPDRVASYSIVVASSGFSSDARFAGTYQFFVDGKRTTRDLTGEGTRSLIFDAQDLVFVRVHGSSPDSLYSLTISREGEVIFDSPTVSGGQPILYHAKSSFDSAPVPPTS